MKIMSMIIIMLITQMSFAQCKYLQNGLDDMTGQQIRITKFETLYLHPYGTALNVQAGRVDDRTFLQFRITMGKATAIDAGADVIVKFLTGETITLQVQNFELPDGYALINTVQFDLDVMVPVPDEHVQQLGSKQIEKIRFYFTDGFNDWTIKPKNHLKVAELIRCL